MSIILLNLKFRLSHLHHSEHPDARLTLISSMSFQIADDRQQRSAVVFYCKFSLHMFSPRPSIKSNSPHDFDSREINQGDLNCREKQAELGPYWNRQQSRSWVVLRREQLKGKLTPKKLLIYYSKNLFHTFNKTNFMPTLNSKSHFFFYWY